MKHPDSNRSDNASPWSEPPALASAVGDETISRTWRQLLLASTIPMVATSSLVNFAPVLPLVREEFGLSNTLAGLLASAGLFAHTMLQLPGGEIVDVVGVRRAMVLGSLLMGVSVLAAGLAPNFQVLLALRLMLGLGTAVAFIAALSLVNATVPEKDRAVAQGFFGAASNIGVLA